MLKRAERISHRLRFDDRRHVADIRSIEIGTSRANSLSFLSNPGILST